MFVGILFLTLFLVARFTERNKKPWRKLFTFLFTELRQYLDGLANAIQG